MSDRLAQRFVALFVSGNATLALALLLPMLADRSQPAGLVSATLAFAALYLLAFSLSFYLLGLTLSAFGQLTVKQRLMGLQPFLLVALCGLYLLGRLQV